MSIGICEDTAQLGVGLCRMANFESLKNWFLVSCYS